MRVICSHKMFLFACCGMIASILLFGLLLSGCGKKTRPVPSGPVLPAAIDDLHYEMHENSLTLKWSFPTRTIHGQRLVYKIKGFELLRARIPATDYYLGYAAVFEPPVTVNGEIIVGRYVSYTLPLPEIGYRYLFKVRSRAGWRVTSGDSNVVSVVNVHEQ